MRLQTTLLSLLAAACAVGVAWFALSLGGRAEPRPGGASLAIDTEIGGADESDSSPAEETGLLEVEAERSGDATELDLLGGGESLAGARREAAAAGSPSEWVARLTVEDLRSSAPVGGARVLGVFLDGEPVAEKSAWRATESDEEGTLEVVVRLSVPELADDETPSPRIDLRVGAEGYSVASVPSLAVSPDRGAGADLGGVPARLVLLQPAASLVLDVLGAPLNGSGELALWFAPKARREEPDLSLLWPLESSEDASVATALDGAETGVSFTVAAASGGARRVRFHGLPPGSLSIALAVEGYPLALQQALMLSPGEELVESIELTPGESAAGIVVDLETRQPVNGVEVHAIPAIPWISERINRRPYPGVTTDPSGRFLLSGVPKGPIGIELITPDGASHERKLTVVAGNHARKHELRVRGTGSLAGTLVVPSDSGLVDAQVLVTTAEAAASVRFVDGRLEVLGKGGPGVFAEVNVAAGSFFAQHVPSGRKLIAHAIAKGMTHGTVSIPPLGLDEAREGVRLYLAERRSVAFRVTASTGETVSGIRASFYGPRYVADEAPEASSVAATSGKRRGRASRWLPWVDLEVEPSGVFRADPALAAIEEIRISWKDRAQAKFVWTGMGGDDIPTFELVPDPIVRVEVTGEDGVAVHGARVVADPVDWASEDRASGEGNPAAPGIRNAKGKESSGRARAFTDEFGRARLRLVRDKEGRVPERYEVRVSAGGYGAVDGIEMRRSDALPSPPIEVTLPRAEIVLPGIITGRIVRRNGEPVVAPRFDGIRGGSAHVDQHSFIIRGVRPGRAKIVVYAEGFEAQKLKPIRIQPGERIDVGEVIMNWASRVEVRVVDAKGKPVPAASVKLTRMPKKQTRRSDLPRAIAFPSRSRPAGVFRRMGVARVPWRLVVNHRGHKPFSKVIRVKKALERVEVALEAIP